MTQHPNHSTSSTTSRRGHRRSAIPAEHPSGRGGAPEQLTVPEVCAELKVSRSTFYYWRQTGKAPRCLVLPNREVRIARPDLESWMVSHLEGEG